MLKRSRAFFDYHIQAIAQSLNLLCRKPVATLMTMVVIAIALALPTLFWIFNSNLSQLTTGWQRTGQISLYLKTPLTQEAQMKLLEKVNTIEGVGQATLKSPEEGLAELTQQEGMQDIMRYLPENPLPAVIQVVPALFVDSPSKQDSLFSQLKGLKQVEQVKLDMEWITRLHAFSSFLSHLTDSLMVLLALAVFLIIGNTMRLALHHKQEEIQILKLIGATDPFILRPFLYSGIWFGLVGAVLAIFLVNIFILSLRGVMNQLIDAYQMNYPITGLSLGRILLLVFFSIILGLLGAGLSVKRQLASIEAYH